jgi:predicted ATPase
MLKEARARLHEAIAAWLQSRAGERVGEIEELLGHHLEQAYRYQVELGRLDAQAAELASQAAERLGAAGRRALARGDMPAATSLLERAISLLPESDRLRSVLSLRLSIALAETGEVSRADALLSERIQAEQRGQHYLLYRDRTGQQRAFDLDPGKGPIAVGRGQANDVVLGWDGEVSRSHAYLDAAEGQWALVDPGSRNGSYVNGERVHDRRPLRDGDVLRFGETVVLYRSPPGSGVHVRMPAGTDSTATRPQLPGL